MGGDKGARMANAMAVVAGRGSRPCDVCARKRSRWYCAADEAYLCEACDNSVHAANALAFRHERVRLTPSGTPMKMEKRNVNHGEQPSVPKIKKKLKNLRPAPSPSGDPIPGSTAFQSSQQHLQNPRLREVKLELHPPNYAINDADHEGSDDHFTAEELTGNANLLDETVPSMCQASYDDSNNPDYNGHDLTQGGEPDFSHDFLVSDPNDPSNNYGTGMRGPGTIDGNTSSAAGGGGVGEFVGDDQDDDDDEDDDDVVGNEWTDLDLTNRDLSDDDYCIDPSALRESVSAGAPDQSVALYSHDQKPVLVSCGMSSSLQMGKAFKIMAGQQEWVKVEDGYPLNYGVAPQQVLTNSSCKMEGLSMSESDLRQVPSLRLNYEDVLSSWSDRSFRCTDDGNGSQLVPGDDTNSDLGSCYDLGLVPDLSSGGIDGGSGQFPHVYGGCGHGGGDDAGNAREFKVNRYREKRRTRKFSKKIRYEVRKVNAERRPRMKGRFVKRSPSRET